VAKLATIVAVALCAACLTGSSALAGGFSIVRAEDLREAVRLYLVQREGRAAERMYLSFRSVPDSIGIKADVFSLRVGMGSSTRARGPLGFVVEVVEGGQTVHRCMVTAVIRSYDTVLVADRTIGRVVAPSADDIRRLRIETTGIDRPLVASLDDLTGKRTRRVITRGNILYADMFEDMPLVHKGSPVYIRVKSGSVNVTTQGVACQDGRAGELIEITVPGKTGRLKAWVADNQTVAIRVD
jgi:flagella basal body P-ring formation protein FlgA